MQAAAAGIEPEAAMNPVLLKPGSDQTSQVVVLGKPWADVSAVSYRQHKAALLDLSLACPAGPPARSGGRPGPAVGRRLGRLLPAAQGSAAGHLAGLPGRPPRPLRRRGVRG